MDREAHEGIERDPENGRLLNSLFGLRSVERRPASHPSPASLIYQIFTPIFASQVFIGNRIP